MIKVVIFDLDGTIYFGDRLADHAVGVLTALHEMKIKTCFLTNNSRKGRADIYRKLKAFGLNVQLEDVYTSSYLVGRYLKDHGFKSAYVFGEAGLVQEMQRFGIRVEDDNPDCVIVGYDMTMTYEKIVRSFKHIVNGKRFIACNLDKSYPIDSGLLPGCGAMVGALSGCTGLTPEVVVGKPSVYPIEVISKDFGARFEEIIVVGDNIETDIEMANNAGCKSCLIMAEEKHANCSMVNSLKDVIEIIKEGIK
jgi:HAD superfamily hydrolase (TIGR01450 family)